MEEGRTHYCEPEGGVGMGEKMVISERSGRWRRGARVIVNCRERPPWACGCCVVTPSLLPKTLLCSFSFYHFIKFRILFETQHHIMALALAWQLLIILQY